MIKGSNQSLLAAILLSCTHGSSQLTLSPRFTPRITHFLAINPSQIYCQVIIYTEASQSEADPHFSNFTTPQIGRGQVLQTGEAAAPLGSVMGEPLLAFWLRCSLNNKIIAVKICVKLQKLGSSSRVVRKRKIHLTYVNRKEREILLKINCGKET